MVKTAQMILIFMSTCYSTTVANLFSPLLGTIPVTHQRLQRLMAFVTCYYRQWVLSVDIPRTFPDDPQ